MKQLAVTLMALMAVAGPGRADVLAAAETLRAGTVLTSADVMLVAGRGDLSDPAEAIGQEARVTLYKGQPIRANQLGPVTLIERNQLVVLIYQSGPLTIEAEGRALGKGGAGDRIKVMNAASRATLSGLVAADGSVQVLATQ